MLPVVTTPRGQQSNPLQDITPPPVDRLGTAGGGQLASPYASIGAGPLASPQASRDVTFPIRELSPYAGRWKLRARVTVKSEIRKFTNARGEGQLFSVEIVDGSNPTDQIRATFFGTAVDKYFNVLQVKQVYTFSKGTVKPANKRFTSVPHDFEITFDERAEVAEVREQDGPGAAPAIPQVPFKFVSIGDLFNHQPGEFVDVATVVVSTGVAEQCQTRFGESMRRHVKIADDSGSTADLTLWGNRASMELVEDQVLVARGLKVSDFGGRSLSTMSSTFLEQNADHPRVFQLQAWWTTRGKAEVGSRPVAFSGSSSGATLNYGQRKSLEECSKEDEMLASPGVGLGFVDAGNGRQVHSHEVGPVTVVHISRDRPPFYRACPNHMERNGQSSICYKKAELVGDKWICGAGHTCDSYPAARWNLSNITIGDASGHAKVSVFGEDGDKLFGHTAQELADLWEQQQNNPEASTKLDKIYEQVHFRRVSMKLRSKKEIWQDQEQVKMVVQKCDPYPGSYPGPKSPSPLTLEGECKRKLQEVRDALGF